MNSNSPNLPSTPKRLIQVNEEIHPPLQVPIMLGNECFVVTQQDIRRIEDTRLLSYCKLTPTGELIPMEALGHDSNAQDYIFNAFRNICMGQGVGNQLAGQDIVTLLHQLLSQKQEALNNVLLANKVAEIKASMQQQLQWSKTPPNSSVPVS